MHFFTCSLVFLFPCSLPFLKSFSTKNLQTTPIATGTYKPTPPQALSAEEFAARIWVGRGTGEPSPCSRNAATSCPAGASANPRPSEARPTATSTLAFADSLKVVTGSKRSRSSCPRSKTPAASRSDHAGSRQPRRFRIDPRHAGLYLYGIQLASQIALRAANQKVSGGTVRSLCLENDEVLAPEQATCEPPVDCLRCPKRDTCRDLEGYEAEVEKLAAILKNQEEATDKHEAAKGDAQPE